MNAPTSNLLVWVGEQTACVRVTGRANFATSVDFKKLLQHLQDTGHPDVLLDFSDCLLMDSTFLGVLAHEASQRQTRHGDRTEPGLELLNPTPRIRSLIEDLGVAHLFRIVERDLSPENFQAVPPTAGTSRAELTRTCLEAHELLMALNPANVAKFKDAARYFAEELQKVAGPERGP